MNILSAFSEKLHELMIENNLNTVGLQKATGCTNSNISKWLNCKKSPKIESLIILADFFDCSIDYLCGRSDNSQKAEKSNLTFQKRLFELINSSGKKVYSISKEIGMPNSQIYKFLKGQSTTLINLVKLAEYFNCSVDYIIGREN